MTVKEAEGTGVDPVGLAVDPVVVPPVGLIVAVGDGAAVAPVGVRETMLVWVTVKEAEGAGVSPSWVGLGVDDVGDPVSTIDGRRVVPVGLTVAPLGCNVWEHS